ncbi:hypothetical protein ULT26_004319 [Salmonella enterica]|nr:hypothetical protein [Salmonella enterica]
MLDKFLVLLERFVVAHELIAANSARRTVTNTAGDVSVTITEAIKEGAIADAIKTTADVARLKQEPEDDLDDEEPEEKPKRKPRQAKPKDEPKGPDVAKLREEIKTKAQAIGVGDSDDVADALEALLDKFNSRTVNKLKDEQVPDFAEGLRPIYIDLLRFENGQMATAMKKTDGADEFNDLLDKYEVSKVKDLTNADVENFHAESKKLVSKYYEVE